MDKEIDLMDILKSNGIEHAVWALRCWDYKDWCLFVADVAESVLPLFEAKHPNDDRPRKAIQAVRDYKAGIISSQELVKANDDAYDAASTYTDIAYENVLDSTNAADFSAADADFSAADAAYAAVVDTDNDAAACEAIADAVSATYCASADAAYANTEQKKWNEIEQLFIKHFGDKQ